jgi:hypothetical protein
LLFSFMERGESSFAYALKPKVRKVLEVRCRAPTTAQRDVKRARIVLLAAEGRSTRSIAEEVGVQPRIISHWRRRALLASAANVLVCSKCKRCSSYKAIEQTLFGCRILKLNVAPFRTMARQNRFPVEYSVAPVPGAHNPIAALTLIGHSLGCGRCDLVHGYIHRRLAIDTNSKEPEPSIPGG